MSDDIVKYIKIIKESIDLNTTANLSEIAKHIKINVWRAGSIDVEFNLPVNETVGKNYTVTTIYMQMDLLNFSKGKSDLSVFYDMTDDAEDIEYDRAMNWFNKGSYTKRLNAHLKRAGFSASAATADRIFAVSSEEINYDADGVQQEIADAAALLLQEHPVELVKKFGPDVLVINIKFSPADIEPIKHDIIKHILVNIKEKGKTIVIDNLVNKLLDLGVQWPELNAIKRSLVAG